MNCAHCGTPLAEGASTCLVCGTAVQTVNYSSPAELREPENVGLGMIGALLGALLGGVSIVLLGQLGFIASISGYLTALCALKGYELLGKQLTKRGIFFCIVLMIVVPVVADAVSWAFVIHESLSSIGATLFDCIYLFPVFLSDGSIPMDSYLSNLGMLYLFVALGGFTTIRNALRKV